MWIGAVYSSPVPPSHLTCVTLTPEPPISLAVTLTLTGETYQPSRPGEPDRVSMETGGVMSGGIGPSCGAQRTAGSPSPVPKPPLHRDAVNHVVSCRLS